MSGGGCQQERVITERTRTHRTTASSSSSSRDSRSVQTSDINSPILKKITTSFLFLRDGVSTGKAKEGAPSGQAGRGGDDQGPRHARPQSRSRQTEKISEESEFPRLLPYLLSARLMGYVQLEKDSEKLMAQAKQLVAAGHKVRPTCSPMNSFY